MSDEDIPLPGTNGHAATKASVASVAKQLNELKLDVRDLRNALVGVPGLSNGVLAEMRDDNAKLREQWASLQNTMPSAINAAIIAADNRRARVIVTGVRSWWVTVASSVVAGVVVAVIILVFHLGVVVK